MLNKKILENCLLLTEEIGDKRTIQQELNGLKIPREANALKFEMQVQGKMIVYFMKGTESIGSYKIVNYKNNSLKNVDSSEMKKKSVEYVGKDFKRYISESKLGKLKIKIYFSVKDYDFKINLK